MLITVYRKGFISGMFDPLHVGHIEIMKQAKSMCNYLIVAVGTDDFIRIRKNHEPLLPYNERYTIIESIRYVDLVVSIENLDKIAMHEKYGFDVMFAGADHKSENTYIDTAEKLKQLGVDTIYFERYKEISSTCIKERMIKLGKLASSPENG